MPAGPADRDQPRSAVTRRCVELVLEQAELLLAADERRLERLRPHLPAAIGDDTQGAIGVDRRRLALELLLTGRLEHDRGRALRSSWPR